MFSYSSLTTPSSSRYCLRSLFAGDQRVMLEAGFELVEHHERVDRACFGMGHQGVGDLVLHVAGRDAHACPSLMVCSRSSLMLSSVKPGKRLAVVELQFLQQRQAGVLGLFEPRQHGPHRGHFDRVRGNVLAVDLLGVVVLFVDLDLVGQARDVRNVDLDRAIAQGLHELVVLQPAILGLVGVAR